jgi:hypothetical protein
MRLDMLQYKHHLTCANEKYRKYMLTRNILPVQKMKIKYSTFLSYNNKTDLYFKSFKVTELQIYFLAKGRPMCQGLTLSSDIFNYYMVSSTRLC